MTTARQDRHLHLGYMYWVNGTHWGGWRHPDAPQDGSFDFRYALRAARLVEDAKFDFFFLGDTLPGDIVSDQWRTTHNTGRLEPFTLASQLALETEHIGLVVTAHPTFYDPYILARLTASLDHLSSGRLAWNVVLGASDVAARNFSMPDLGGAARYARADEHIAVVKLLWDSIEEGAYVQDKASGRYVDETKIHRIGWRGEHFQVEGTLPLLRPPQGHPPLLYAGESEASRTLSARHADINFTGPKTIGQSLAFNRDVRARAEALGRNPAEIFFLPGIAPLVGDSRRHAVALYDELNHLLPLDEDPIHGGKPAGFWTTQEGRALNPDHVPLGRGTRNLASVSARVGADLTELHLDDELPPALADLFNDYGRELLSVLVDRTGRTVGGPAPALAEDLLYTAIVAGFPLVIGSAEQVANRLQEWFEIGAADGFNVNSPFLWNQLERFTTEVVPLLQQRGLYRTEYSTSTFRGHFGLPLPSNIFEKRKSIPYS